MELHPLSEKTKTILILFAIIAINFFIRIPNLSFPATAVFDEKHFATYAAKYSSHEPFIDIHPPLGKLLYALPLSFFPKPYYEKAHFVDYEEASNNYYLKYKKHVSPVYGDFPYLSLRIVSALFGALTIGAAYLFFKALLKNGTTALIAASLLTLDNALILESRLILINHMFLSLGFFGLWLAVKKKILPACICIWLSLSVKLIGLVFLIAMAIIFASQKLPRIERRKIYRYFLFSGLAIIVFFIVLGNIVVPIEAKYALFKTSAFPNLSDFHSISLFSAYLATTLLQGVITFFGYTLTAGVPETIRGAMWYEWPFMGGIFNYWSGNLNSLSLVLIGNPIVWGLGTSGVIIAIIRMFRRKTRMTLSSPLRTLVLIYFLYLAVFALLVRRISFLYHYFPALILSIGIFSALLTEHLETKSRNYKIATVIILVFSGVSAFILLSPYTYGFKPF